MTNANRESATGEVVADPRMPPEIAAAIIKVKQGVAQLGFDERNEHGRYNYASIDKFYTSVRPLESEAGLAIMLDEQSFDVRSGESGKPWAFLVYEVWLTHKTGLMWGPVTKHWAGPVTGPQTFGAAESYVRKAFMRGLYMVPTGEKDADDIAPRDDAPITASRAKPAVATAQAGRGDANMVYRRIRDEIRGARTLHELNSSGIFRDGAEDDYDLIRKQVNGQKVWEDLVALDADRRASLS